MVSRPKAVSQVGGDQGGAATIAAAVARVAQPLTTAFCFFLPPFFTSYAVVLIIVSHWLRLCICTLWFCRNGVLVLLLS